MIETHKLDSLIAELLGIICLFEHKIQLSKQSLSGYSTFDPRSLFNIYDKHYLGYITSCSLSEQLSSRLSHAKNQLPLLINKYGKSGKLTYEQFLQMISSKNKKTLAQTLLLRNHETLEPYLVKKFQDLLLLHIVMLAQVQKIKRKLIYENDVNIEDIYEKIKGYLHSQNGILQYLAKNGIQVEKQSVKYLKNHVNVKGSLKQSDIREMFSPITASMRQKQSQLPLESKLNSTYSYLPTQTKTNFLNVKYKPRNTLSQTMTLSKKQHTFRKTDDKQNAEALELAISSSIVKQVQISVLPTTNPSPTDSIPLLDLFGKNSRVDNRREKSNSPKNKNYSSYTCNILDKFSVNPILFKQKVAKSPKSKVYFEDNSSLVSESAFRYY